ncbi:MAG: hypothetical protein AABX29_02070 [Nanoarchaeota archaeon]
MEKISSEEVQNILKKYEERLSEQINLDQVEHFSGDKFSREYNIFREEALGRKVTVYERLCNFCENILKITQKEKERTKLQKAIELIHLEITPEGANSFGSLVAIILILSSIIFGVFYYYFSGVNGLLSVEGGIKDVGFSVYLLPLIFLGIAAGLMKPLINYPMRLANRYRLKATNQMVLCILYVVMYMRHTSNLEHAIKFAGEHIGNPLALDLRKIFWDVETGKYFTIKESLDYYLEGWRDTSLEFVESFHLIEGSLYEGDENRRISLLEKALEVILNGTYEKMLHYAHDLRSPITMLYMLGVILPVLGLVIFPLMSGFLEGLVKWWHIALVYDVMLPIFVYVFGMNLLEKRPTGYGDEDLLDIHPEYEKLTYLQIGKIDVNPAVFGIFFAFVIILIGLMPILIHLNSPTYDFSIMDLKFLDYKCTNEGCVGPYGLWSMVLSLFVPLGVAFGFAFTYYYQTRKLMNIRKNSKKLDLEFSGAIFQLGNRVADGIPVESSFGKVAESMVGTPTGDFFRIVDTNVRRLGMSVKEAIFNKENGGIIYFPSSLIKTSMKVLIESAKKGTSIVAKSLLTISDYVNRVHAIDERLKDLLADILSSMKSQISFLTPMIAGIVVGVTSLMINIINGLTEALSQTSGAGGEEAAQTVAGVGGGLGGILNVLNIKDIIPGFQFQIVIGIFVVEVVIILTILSSGIENGIDKLFEKNKIAKNLMIAVGLYLVISLVAILLFSVLASGIITVNQAVSG